MPENVYLKGKLKHVAGFVRNLLECEASTGLCTLICLTPQHADFVSTDGKKMCSKCSVLEVQNKPRNKHKDKKGALTWRKMHHY